MRLIRTFIHMTLTASLLAAALLGTTSPARAAPHVIAVPTAAAASRPALPGDNIKFTDAVFQATHNSYSGGDRGTIEDQLNYGSRFFEFDIWNTDHAFFRDFRIGHWFAGDDIDTSGTNPDTASLRPWLEQIAVWSTGHPTAAPITVMLDLKSDLSAQDTNAAGNLAALNNELTAVFGATLVPVVHTSANLGTIGQQRGKILALLSGSATSRLAYKRDLGDQPAVALNAHNQVVEVDRLDGVLYYWSGQVQANRTIHWYTRGRIGSGVTPAVAISTSGRVVEVNREGDDTLVSRAGTIGGDGEITWGPADPYDHGITPTVEFTGPTRLLEIHKSQNHNQNWHWIGILTADDDRVHWEQNNTTDRALLPKTTSQTFGGRTITVGTGGIGPYPSNALHSTVKPDGVAHLISYAPVAYIEAQNNESSQLEDGTIFYGAHAPAADFVMKQRRAGHIVRVWAFNTKTDIATPSANFPATDYPTENWYRTMLATNPDYVS